MLHRMQRYYLRCLSHEKSKNASISSRLLEKEIKIMLNTLLQLSNVIKPVENVSSSRILFNSIDAI